MSVREPDWTQTPPLTHVHLSIPALKNKNKQNVLTMGNVPSFRSAREGEMEPRASTKETISIYIYLEIHTLPTDNMESDRRIKQDMTQNIRQEHDGKGALALVLHCFWFVQYFSSRQVREAEWN